MAYRNRRRRLPALLAGTFLAAIVPGTAHAACLQGDLAGTWHLAVDTVGGDTPADVFALTCMVTLERSGRIVWSQCRQIGTTAEATLTQAGGARFIVDRGCRIVLADAEGGGLALVRDKAVTAVASVTGELARNRGAIFFGGAVADGNIRLRAQGFRS